MKSKEPVEISVARENILEFLNFYTTVKNFADSGIDVPALYVKRLIELMSISINTEIPLSLEDVIQYSKMAVKKLKEVKDYQFSWIDTVLTDRGTHLSIKNDTQKIFAEMIFDFFLFKIEHDVEKDDVIIFFYRAFHDVYRCRLDPECHEYFNPRRQAIISGILAMSAGYKLATKVDTEEQIYQATRNAIAKYLKN